jgi:hypothetical protein
MHKIKICCHTSSDINCTFFLFGGGIEVKCQAVTLCQTSYLLHAYCMFGKDFVVVGVKEDDCIILGIV